MLKYFRDEWSKQVYMIIHCYSFLTGIKNILSTVYVSQQATNGNKWCTVDILHYLSFCTNDILEREV